MSNVYPLQQGVSDEGIFFQVTWHALTDACPKCRELDGEVWTSNKFEGTLIHPNFGAVYDLDADVSLTHPNCRCYLEIDPYVNLEETDLYKSLEPIFMEANMEMPSNIQEANVQVDKLRANVGQCRGELREMEYVLYRTTSVLSRLGLPLEVEKATQKIERMIMMVRIFHSATMYLEMGTPEGWILGIISAVSFAISLADQMEVGSASR
jgi:hypothetical protein